MAAAGILFDDLFTIRELDKGGPKFDRVSRLEAHSDNHDMNVTLDFHNELFPIQDKEKFSLALASDLNVDPTGQKDALDLSRLPSGTLADEWEYVMYGKVYKFDEGTQEKVKVYISFGGLLMCLEGNYRHISQITVGSEIYSLMRKS
ncbi:uncharacterized protein L969DRAFT_97249 [Mixia osmundae IAM 14324]|uniref:DNA-directed RNA polymerases I, II, and III subunit RPABC3 n=1 Tax=Mixia osmundae (strain CBS 9802 / IAM 14324 / JCM 22182 / KY 12970) TaxID=764103 RepID=G7DW99_MIXOS|nr:uncharacterized protein L969DRAFT_97249 [Mixia osmundae IAM 14324]KEI36514.1 hypothetical protein L969DRAFT_97249 [Mixia osmundae IAM 14324]GAA94787.1 hypothetical protein E5Q_01441 [Mixia osmundae IAM 14324]